MQNDDIYPGGGEAADAAVVLGAAGAGSASARGSGCGGARLALVLVLFLNKVDFHRRRGLHHHPSCVVGT